LGPADEFAVLFNQVTAETGVGLVSHAAERRVELADLREIEGPDFYPRVLVVLLEILRNTLSFILSDDRVPRRPFRQIPAISLWIQRGLFPRQVAKQPGALIFAPGPDQIRRLQIETRIRFSFQAVTPGTVVLNHLLDASLITA
jgi:hypothetical protein